MPKRKKQLKTEAGKTESQPSEKKKKSTSARKPICGSLKGSLTFIGDIVSPVGEDDWEAANEDEAN